MITQQFVIGDEDWIDKSFLGNTIYHKCTWGVDILSNTNKDTESGTGVNIFLFFWNSSRMVLFQTKLFPETSAYMFANSPLLENCFTASEVISFALNFFLIREGFPCQWKAHFMVGKGSRPRKWMFPFLERLSCIEMSEMTISNNMRGSQNSKTLPRLAQMGNFSWMEYPLILKNIHPWSRVGPREGVREIVMN